MSYAICNVVVGYHLDGPLSQYVRECVYIDSQLGLSPKDFGCTSLYSAGGPAPMYCGVRIYQFDECNRLTAKELIQHIQPTAEQIEKAKELLIAARKKIEAILHDEVLDDDEKEEILSCLPEEPDVHLREPRRLLMAMLMMSPLFFSGIVSKLCYAPYQIPVMLICVLFPFGLIFTRWWAH